MRSSLLEVMGEEFVQTARAKGVRDKDVRRRHAVPNALLPDLHARVLQRRIHPGRRRHHRSRCSRARDSGQLTYAAIDQEDYPVIQAIFLLSSAAVIFFNLLADILYGYLDPRVKEA